MFNDPGEAVRKAASDHMAAHMAQQRIDAAAKPVPNVLRLVSQYSSTPKPRNPIAWGRWLFGVAVAIAIAVLFLRGCGEKAHAQGVPPPEWSLTPVALPESTPTPVMSVHVSLVLIAHEKSWQVVAPPLTCGGVGEAECP